ncbi:MAG TPA: tetratricopeptide repeat protein [Thermoanaerobaculia bacterium]|nr:tetratricopeptide repeat protein [Thermoanaerobaculia bacterium]
MKSPLLLIALLVATPSLLPAWQKPAGPPVVDQAVEKLRAGDVKGALALLEPLRGKTGAPPAALSLLGALYLQIDRPQDALALLGPLADSEAAGPVILDNAGRAALAVGQTEKGERYLERAVAKAPVSPASRELGLLRGRQGRPVDSYKLLRPWALANPQDEEARLAAAFCALELNRPPEARELLNGLKEDNPRVRLLLGKLLLLEGDPRTAISTLEPLLKGGPPSLDLDARRFLAEAYSLVGESGRAVELLKGRTAGSADLSLLLAKAQYQSGSPADSAATLAPFARDLLAREPASPAERALAASLVLEYGRALVGTAKWPEAAAALEKATQLDPTVPQAWQLLGQAQLASGQREEATKSVAKFRELQSAEKGQSEQMRDAEAGQKDPTGRNLQQALDLANKGQGDEALRLIHQEKELAGTDPRPRTTEVRALLLLQRPQEALQAAEAAVQSAPDNPDFLSARGAALLALGKLPEAERDLRRALELQPNHQGAMNDLARLTRERG